MLVKVAEKMAWAGIEGTPQSIFLSQTVGVASGQDPALRPPLPQGL